MPITWDTEADLDSIVDRTGVTNDGLGDHSGRGVLDHGYQYGSLTRGLVAYYPFDGDVNDATTLGNDGTDNTSAGYNGSGQVGSDSKDFDGSNDYVATGNSSFGDGSTNISVAAWVNSNKSNDSTYRSITSRWGGDVFLFQKVGSGEVKFQVSESSSNSASVTDSSAISTSTWIHYCGTYNGSTVRLYRDGSQVASTSASFTLNTASSEMMVGKTTGGSNYWHGLIDDIRFYDRVLSQQEVNKLSNITETQTVNDGDVL